jgi:tetratricopeptide (TPR) repeat protein
VVGQDHPDVAMSYGNMAGVYNSQGKYEQALDYLQKSLSINITTLGRDHLDVATSKYNMALLHKRGNETDRARQLFLECEQIYAKVYGPDHSETNEAARQASRCL